MHINGLGRRAFVGACAALLGLTSTSCATAPPAATQVSASERSVAITTADGSADAMLFMPAGAGRWPAVVIWPDLSGLRPAYAEIGRKLAGEGFVVLAPNSFYRSVKLDGSAATAQPSEDFMAVMKRGAPWRAAASDPAIMSDTKAYVAFLEALPQVDPAAKIGMLGYDIGGAHAFVAARALPDRIGAVAAVHPLAIATSRDTSPHLYVDQSKAAYLVEIARPDDEREPGDKDDLRKAFADAGLSATVDIIPANHGFGVADQAGYDAAVQASVWSRVVDFLRAHAG